MNPIQHKTSINAQNKDYSPSYLCKNSLKNYNFPFHSYMRSAMNDKVLYTMIQGSSSIDRRRNTSMVVKGHLLI